MAVIRAYTLEQAVRLAKVSERQVAYWASRDVLQPSILYDRERRPTRYLYSFHDVVGLRVIGMLRKQYRLSLQMLTKAGKRLSEFSEKAWPDLTFWVRGTELFFYDPNRDALVATDGSYQSTARIEIERVAAEIRKDAEELAKRQPEDIGQTERHRNVQGKRLVVKGTRVPVDSVLSLAGDGYDAEAIVKAYPALTLDDVAEILAYSKLLAVA